MNHESLSELRALQRAPEEVEELLVAVIVIMKGPSADFSWTKGAKRLMANLDRYTYMCTFMYTVFLHVLNMELSLSLLTMSTLNQ